MALLCPRLSLQSFRWHKGQQFHFQDFDLTYIKILLWVLFEFNLSNYPMMDDKNDQIHHQLLKIIIKNNEAESKDWVTLSSRCFDFNLVFNLCSANYSQNMTFFLLPLSGSKVKIMNEMIHNVCIIVWTI